MSMSTNKQKVSNNKQRGRRTDGDAPAAKLTTAVKRGPRVTPKVGGGVVVSNSEYLTDVVDDGTIRALDINPRLATFTWISRTAQNYEHYRVKSMVFSYTPTCSSSTSGIIVMAVDYDSSDGPPADKQGISTYVGSVRINVWASTKCVVQPKEQPFWYYTSPDADTTNPTGTDIKLYQPGRFFWGVFNGSATGATVGELTVSYEVEFKNPQVATTIGPSACFFGPITGNAAVNPFNVSGATTNTNADIVFKDNKITFKTPGQYLIDMMVNAQTATSQNMLALYNVTQSYGTTSTSLTWKDYAAASGVGSPTPIIGVLEVVAAAGTILTFAATTAASSATVFAVYRVRIANFLNKLEP